MFYVFGFIGIFWSFIFLIFIKEHHHQQQQQQQQNDNNTGNDNSAIIASNNSAAASTPVDPIIESAPSISAADAAVVVVEGSPTREENVTLNEQVVMNENTLEESNLTVSTLPFSSKFLTYCKLLANPAVWAIIVAHTSFNYGWYILISWLPGYIKMLGVSSNLLGIITNLPYIVGFICSNLSGIIADALIPRLGVLLVRRLMITCAFFGSGLCYALLRYFHGQIVPSVILVCLAVGFGSFHRAGYFVNHMDIATAKYAGTLMGISNTVATVPGIIGNIVTGIILTRSGGDWTSVFNEIIVIYMIGGLFFLIFAKGHIIFK